MSGLEACVPWRVELDGWRDLSGLQEAKVHRCKSLWRLESKLRAYYCCTLPLLFAYRQTRVFAMIVITHQRGHIWERVPARLLPGFRVWHLALRTQ